MCVRVWVWRLSDVSCCINKMLTILTLCVHVEIVNCGEKKKWKIRSFFWPIHGISATEKICMNRCSVYQIDSSISPSKHWSCCLFTLSHRTSLLLLSARFYLFLQPSALLSFLCDKIAWNLHMVRFSKSGLSLFAHMNSEHYYYCPFIVIRHLSSGSSSKKARH